jgi:hypothetical protein
MTTDYARQDEACVERRQPVLDEIKKTGALTGMLSDYLNKFSVMLDSVLASDPPRPSSDDIPKRDTPKHVASSQTYHELVAINEGLTNQLSYIQLLMDRLEI